MGATSGIGREVALMLAQRGWKVGIAARRSEQLEALKEMNDNIVAYEVIDVCHDDATAALHRLIDALGGMNLYFHSSGIGFHNIDLDATKELSTISTNCMGMARMVGEAFRYFESENNDYSHIAVISSIARTKGLGAAPAYSASKRFTSHYLECLEQLKRIRHLTHIYITDIRPGFVRTPLIEGSKFPYQLQAKAVAADILKAIDNRKSIVTINTAYRILVWLWKLIPRWTWIRLSWVK